MQKIDKSCTGKAAESNQGRIIAFAIREPAHVIEALLKNALRRQMCVSKKHFHQAVFPELLARIIHSFGCAVRV
jgi:hypothetical protein